MRTLLSAAIAAATLSSATVTHADGLIVFTTEFGSWTESVARLERQSATPQTLHVGVRDDVARPVACGAYRLNPDAVGLRAFTIGACDPSTGLTELRVTRSEALFMRRPGAEPLRLGVRLSAMPVAPGTVPTPAPLAETSTPVPSSVDEVIDLPAIELSAGGPIRESRVATTCVEAPPIAQGVTVDGTTLDGSQRPVYRIHLSTRTSLRLDVSSSFGGEIDLYRACPDESPEIAFSSVFGVGPAQRLSWDLRAGDYYVVVVDADIHPHRGRYAIRTEEQRDYLASVR